MCHGKYVPERLTIATGQSADQFDPELDGYSGTPNSLEEVSYPLFSRHLETHGFIDYIGPLPLSVLILEFLLAKALP